MELILPLVTTAKSGTATSPSRPTSAVQLPGRMVTGLHDTTAPQIARTDWRLLVYQPEKVPHDPHVVGAFSPIWQRQTRGYACSPFDSLESDGDLLDANY